MTSTILEELSRSYTAYLNLRRTIDRELREEKARRLKEARVQSAMLAARARAEGASVYKIAQLGLGTTARQTAYSLIEEGERYLNPAVAAGATGASTAPVTEFQWADTQHTEVTVTPTAADLEKYAAHAGVEPGDHPTASFRIATTEDGDTYPEPVTPAILDDGTPHPVVMLVQRDPGYATRVVEWAGAAA